MSSSPAWDSWDPASIILFVTYKVHLKAEEMAHLLQARLTTKKKKKRFSSLWYTIKQKYEIEKI